MKFTKEFEKMLEVWGEDAQIMISIEEMSELTKELCKLMRLRARYAGDYDAKEISKKFDDTRKNIQEEIADVLNCIEPLAVMFGHDEVERIREEKVRKAMKKIETAEAEQKKK